MCGESRTHGAKRGKILSDCRFLLRNQQKRRITYRYFDIQGVRELTRPLFAIPTHQFLFHGGKVDKKFYMDNLQLESAEYDLISSPNNGVCLFKCGADRNLLDVHAPPHKHALIVGGEG